MSEKSEAKKFESEAQKFVADGLRALVRVAEMAESAWLEARRAAEAQEAQKSAREEGAPASAGTSEPAGCRFPTSCSGVGCDCDPESEAEESIGREPAETSAWTGLEYAVMTRDLMSIDAYVADLHALPPKTSASPAAPATSASSTPHESRPRNWPLSKRPSPETLARLDKVWAEVEMPDEVVLMEKDFNAAWTAYSMARNVAGSGERKSLVRALEAFVRSQRSRSTKSSTDS